MPKRTYEQLRKQIEVLEAEAEKARRSEAAEVIAHIRNTIAHYGLTAADIGLGSGAKSVRAARKKPGRKPGRPRKVVAATKGRKVAPKYRDDKGNTWAGRGQRPVWLRNALASGKKLEDFAIK